MAVRRDTSTFAAVGLVCGLAGLAVGVGGERERVERNAPRAEALVDALIFDHAKISTRVIRAEEDLRLLEFKVRRLRVEADRRQR